MLVLLLVVLLVEQEQQLVFSLKFQPNSSTNNEHCDYNDNKLA
jgi:hypothetical protein